MALHGAQELHADNWQSTGQGMWQLRVSKSSSLHQLFMKTFTLKANRQNANNQSINLNEKRSKKEKKAFKRITNGKAFFA